MPGPAGGELHSQLNEYAKCEFRFDINVASKSFPDPTVYANSTRAEDSYDVLMQLTTADGRKRMFRMDATMLKLLHEQLERIMLAFPKCYVYKKKR